MGLSAILYVNDANGNRVDSALKTAGGYLPTRLKLADVFTATCRRDGPEVEIALGVDVDALVNFAAVQTALGNADSSVNFNGEKLTGVGDPTDATDATNKTYVDAVTLSNFAAHYDMRATLATGNVTRFLAFAGRSTATAAYVTIVATANVAASGTDYRSWSLVELEAGAGNLVATLATGTTIAGYAADDPVLLWSGSHTFSGAGDALALRWTSSGAGVVIPVTTGIVLP